MCFVNEFLRVMLLWVSGRLWGLAIDGHRHRSPLLDGLDPACIQRSTISFLRLSARGRCDQPAAPPGLRTIVVALSLRRYSHVGFCFLHITRLEPFGCIRPEGYSCESQPFEQSDDSEIGGIKIKHALQKTIPILSLGARLLLTRPKLSVVFFAVYSFDPMSDPESLLTFVRSSYAAPCSWLSWHSSPSFYFKAGPPDSPRMSAMLCARLQTFHCFRLSILLRKYGNS